MEAQVLFVVLSALGCLTGFSTTLEIRPPRITPVKEDFDTVPNTAHLLTNATRRFRLLCEGQQPVNWTFPDAYSYYGGNFKNLSTWHQEMNSDYPYAAHLDVESAFYEDTGNYTCFYATGVQAVKNSTVYIYIFDQEHLVIDEKILQYIAYEHGNVLIHCRPTSPYVKVSLLNDNMEVHVGSEETGLDKDTIYAFYDPTVGFILENVLHMHTDSYGCMGEYGPLEQEFYFTLSIRYNPGSLPKPYIAGESKVAEDGTIALNCTLVVVDEVYFSMNWLPSNHYSEQENRLQIENSKVYNERDENDMLKRVGFRTLQVVNVTKQDAGNYTCVVQDGSSNTNNQTISIEVVGKDVSYINWSTERANLTTTELESVQWVVDIDAFPPVETFKWTRDHPESETVFLDDGRLSYQNTSKVVTLKINPVYIKDAGIYFIWVSTAKESKAIPLRLDVKSMPVVDIVSADNESYYLNDKSYEFNCSVIGYPKPDITWGFKSCNPLHNCESKPRPIPRNKVSKEVSVDGKLVSTLIHKFELPGYLFCLANNSEGFREDVLPILVSDIPNGFVMEGKTQAFEAIEGENITMTCAASKYNNSDVQWGLNDTSPLTTSVQLPNVNIAKKTTQYSHQKVLTITNISKRNNGYYRCLALSLMNNDQADGDHVKVIVRDMKKPVINSKDLDGSTVYKTTHEKVEWTCQVTGVPTPIIRWFKDGKLINVHTNQSVYEILNHNETLVIKYQSEKTEGKYTCEASSRAGTVQGYRILKFSGGGLSVGVTITMVIFVIIVLGLLAVLVIKIRREQKLRRKLKIAGLSHFEEGALECLNPDLPIDEQAELLPYDKKWEFPRDNLKLGKQLGAGAFGIVMKAEATGIIEGEVVTTVAVKMVKRNAEYTYIKALASELKIMVHLGKHLNVVNLLGACTKNLSKRELLVIVEYCQFGNLHNYLLRHRKDFIDQIDPVTGEIDPSIGAEILARHESFNSQSRLKYAALSFSSNSGDMTVDYRASESGSSSGDNVAAICMTPTGEEGCTLSNNSIQPEWRSNYRGDYKGKVHPICTRDLLCWAFQVARGMEYLAGRKVLHGDLAARNILLADNNVVKICDFGLAKSMYKTDNYRKKGDGPLPVKWMAIESIRDRVFSTQSDVWSFGIVLWEFFSLARTPYPGMEADEKLYNKLVEGYRMDKPDFATHDMCNTIEQCWLVNPNDRPTFTELSEQLGNMLEETVRMHYIDLNGPYMEMNTMWKTNAQSDYLAMMSAPTYGNLVSPHIEDDDSHQYVNSPARIGDPSETGESSGYLCMKSPDAVIFSPRPNNSGVFNFKVRNDSQGSAVTDELRPMLSGGRDRSDSDNGYKSPGTPQLMNNLNKDTKSTNILRENDDKPKQNFAPSFSNPSYQTVSPIISATQDNYVHMPQQKLITTSKPDQKSTDLPPGFSNPNYLSMGKVQDIVDNSDGIAKDTDSDRYVNMPGHGHNLSNSSPGFQSDIGESPYVN